MLAVLIAAIVTAIRTLHLLTVHTVAKIWTILLVGYSIRNYDLIIKGLRSLNNLHQISFYSMLNCLYNILYMECLYIMYVVMLNVNEHRENIVNHPLEDLAL